MFERRLKLLLIVLAVPTVSVILRLVQLQVVRATAYQTGARQMLIKPVRFFPCLRGNITDRRGRPLAHDTESWNICVHYGILAKDKDYLHALAGGPSREQVAPERQRQLERKIEASWHAIADLTDTPLERLMQVRDRTVRDVQRIREIVSRRRGIDTTVLEERMVHPVVKGLSRDGQVEARLRLADYPWVEVVASHTRRYAGGEAVGPFLGLLREVDPDDLDNDPNGDDELARYRPGERRGLGGVEALAEQWLRGRRGREQKDIEGRLISPPVKHRNGKDFRLTIDLPLQQTLYEQLAAAVRRYPLSTGGCAVVLDVPSRHVLAMVSYPSFDPNVPWTGRQLLARDQLGQPTKFRAVGEGRCYPPGSLVKPMILAAALTDGKLSPTETITCQGRLLPDVPDKWRCSATWGHGTVDPVYSIQHSCNVFYYVVGERIGVPGLARWMSRFGFGRLTGTGLPEERRGNLPTRGGVGDARNMSIGQWRLEATPMQVVNMMATIASGVYRPVTIWADDARPRPATRLPVRDEYWRIVRRGLYQVVNEPGGTAFGRATLTNVGDYVLSGKTGSAEPPPQESLYTCHFSGGRFEVIRAPNRRELLARYPADRKPEITHQEPAAEYPTHAWFTGYLTSRQHDEAPAAGSGLSVAIAVVIEYAGHGGEVAGPVARDMIYSILNRNYRGKAEMTAGAMR